MIGRLYAVHHGVVKFPALGSKVIPGRFALRSASDCPFWGRNTVNIRHLLSSVSRWNPRLKATRRSHPVRSAYPAAVRSRRNAAPSTAGSARRRLLIRGGLALSALLLLLALFIVLPMPDGSGIRQWWSQLGSYVQKQSKERANGQTCLPAEQQKQLSQQQMDFSLAPIPVGSYNLPTPTSGLYPFMHFHHLETIVIDDPVAIQEQPVTRTLFKQYADFIENQPPGEEKERLLSHLGLSWNQGEAGSPAVKGVSLEAALDFSQWLSQKTGCVYEIPSREEWAAAIIHGYNSGVPLPNPTDSFDSTPLKSLLQGGSEWTRSSCAVGNYLVGEEDWGTESKGSQPICMPGLFAVAGFRVVLHPARQRPQTSEAAEKTNH